MLIDEKLNLKSFLHDAMDFHAVRQLMVKSRHKILMPTLVLHLTKTKTKQAGEYRSSFGRNLHERTDEPVFTIEDAIGQLKTYDPKRTDLEKSMDEFFITHLPEQVFKAAGDHQNNELDEEAIRREIRSELPNRRYRTQYKLDNGPQGSDKRDSVNISNYIVKRQKSDLMLAFMDSSPQVEKLALKSEMGHKIQKMRTVANSKHRGCVLAPPSKFKNETLERLQPGAKTVMSPVAFKRKYSQDSSKGVAIRHKIEPIVANVGSKQRTSIETADPHPSPSICPQKRDATDSSDPEKSESDDSDAIGELDINDGESLENAPADRLASDESGPKEDESGDAEGKVPHVVV